MRITNIIASLGSCIRHHPIVSVSTGVVGAVALPIFASVPLIAGAIGVAAAPSIAGRCRLAYFNARYGAELDRWVRSAPVADDQDLEVYGTDAFWRAKVAKAIRECIQGNKKTLSLSFLRLTELPNCIGALTQLRELNLSCNELQTVPESISRLTKLKKLNVHSNKFQTVPESISRLTRLKNLNLSRNLLQTVPNSITLLTRLKHLYLGENSFQTFPESIRYLTQLRELCLNNNQLQTIPNSISQLTRLKKLILFRNRIQTLPDYINRLTRLKNLNLAGNLFQTFPEAIIRLTQLRELFLTENRLQTIPDSINRLTQLRRLYFENNAINRIPSVLATLPNLIQLRMEANRLSSQAIVEFQDILGRQPPRQNGTSLNPIFSVYEERLVDNATPLETFRFWLSERQKLTQPVSGTPDRYPSGPEDQSFFERYAVLFDDESNGHDCGAKLVEFLKRLKGTADYKEERTRGNVIVRVDQMLQDACGNKQFRDQMFTAIHSALTTCDDKVQYAFNDIEIYWKLFCGPPLSDVEFAKLLIGVRRLKLVNEFAKHQIATRGLGDHVEVYLGYQLALRERLSLPLSMEGILYPDMSGATPDLLNTAENLVLFQTWYLEQVVDLLCEPSPNRQSDDQLTGTIEENKHWIPRILAGSERFAKLRDEYSENVISLSEGEQIEATTRFKNIERAMAKELTRELLRGHFP